MKTKLIILLLLCFISLFGETLVFQLQFELPKLSRDGEFTRLKYEDCQSVGEEKKIQTRDGLETYTGHPCPD